MGPEGVDALRAWYDAGNSMGAAEQAAWSAEWTRLHQLDDLPASFVCDCGRHLPCRHCKAE